MKTVRKLAAAAAIAFVAGPAFSAELVIGSGAANGTYYPVIQEIAEFCNSSTLTVSHYIDPETNDTGGGSVANLRRILNNKAAGGIVQADVAHLEKMSNPAMERVLALLPLHEEHVHIIVPAVVSVMVKEAEEGFLGFGGSEAEYAEQPNPLRMVSDLQGVTVAAWGGSVTTAKVVSQLGQLGFTVVDAKNEKDAFAMLDSGEAAAVLAVAGAPVKWVEDLPAKRYSLLQVSDRTQETLGAVYGVSGISYDNLGATGQQLKALAVDALLMTRTYRTDDMVGALANLQSCVREKIFEIQDTPGTHPAWQNIDPARDMKWDAQFTAPASSTVTVGSTD